MQVEDCFQLGQIRRPHGILGEVKAFFDVDDIEPYIDKESVYILQGSKLTPFVIETFRPISGTLAVIKFQGIYDRTQAESLGGAEMYLPLSELPPLEDGQFYYHDIIGYKIVDAREGELGTVERIIEMPGNDLIDMKYQARQVFIPMNDAIVKRADHATRSIHTELPEGLLEIYMGNSKGSDN